jgi:hypothetical protein
MSQSFLALPAEMRIQVYRSVIQAASQYHIKAFTHIRLLCRQIKEEFDYEYIRWFKARWTRALALALLPPSHHSFRTPQIFQDCQTLHIDLDFIGATRPWALDKLGPFVETIIFHVTTPLASSQLINSAQDLALVRLRSEHRRKRISKTGVWEPGRS